MFMSYFAKAENSGFYDSLDFLPNSLSYQSAQSTTELGLSGNQKLDVRTKSFTSNEITQLTSRLQIKKIRLESKNFFDVSWGPTGSFAYYPFAIDSGDVFFSETDFQFMRVLLGYGP